MNVFVFSCHVLNINQEQIPSSYPEAALRRARRRWSILSHSAKVHGSAKGRFLGFPSKITSGVLWCPLVSIEKQEPKRERRRKKKKKRPEFCTSQMSHKLCVCVDQASRERGALRKQCPLTKQRILVESHAWMIFQHSCEATILEGVGSDNLNLGSTPTVVCTCPWRK